MRQPAPVEVGINAPVSGSDTAAGGRKLLDLGPGPGANQPGPTPPAPPSPPVLAMNTLCEW